ncbi:MAG: hypothetical protein QF662_06405, partial [Phycisphaerae bacterium]|nr:hypothetical protein [Phycisphaerae bacterium]
MRTEIPKSAKRFFLMVAVALAGGALVGSALAGGDDAEKAEDKKPAPIRWGKAVGGLQIGVACDLNHTPSNRQPTFTVAFKNVGETGLKIPSPLGYSQKRLLKDNWVLYSRPLKLLMIQRVAGQASEEIILGAEKPKASSGIVALKPGETKKYSGIALMNETVRVKGKQSVPNRRKFILLPSSSCRVAFLFENSQERIGRTKVWTGQADTGEVLVRVEPPELKGKPLTARFELEKAKKPARRRKKPRPNIKNPVAVKYCIGEPIYITFAVTNEGDEPLGLRVGSRARREGRHNEFWFEAAGVNDVVEDLPYRGGVSMAHEPEQNPILKHGETHERKLLLNKWLLFNKPGKYTITCSRTMVVGENKEQLYLWPARALPTVPFEGEIE